MRGRWWCVGVGEVKCEGGLLNRDGCWSRGGGGREARECGQAVGNAQALSTGCPHAPGGVGRCAERRYAARPHSRPSVLSFIKCRIKALELHAGVVSGEPPVDLGPDAVSVRLPSHDLVAQDLDSVDTAVETLSV